MSHNVLNLQEGENAERQPELPAERVASASLVLVRRTRWFPLRGLTYSLLVHEMLFAIAVVVPWNYWLPPEPPPRRYEVTILKNNEPLLLPSLEPLQLAAPVSGSAPRAPSTAGKAKLSAATSRPFRGMVYKGPQVIVSNPPNPDNYVQTIRQPELVKPPKLPFPLRLPSIVEVKPRMPVPPTPPVAAGAEAQAALRELAAVASVEAVPPPVEATIENPKLMVPMTVVPSALPPDASKAAASSAAPVPAPLEMSSLSGNSTRDLLVLSAIAGPESEHTVVPPGELHGAFAVSPTPPVVSADWPSGTAVGAVKGGTEHGGAIGRPGGSNGTATPSSGGEPGLRPGTRSHLASGETAAGTGAGGNAVSGTGTKHGSGSGAAKGTIAGSSRPAGGPFPGISIQGGSGGAGVSNATLAAAAVTARTPQNNSYGLTIMASGSSGGGLKDYGVFGNEPVYTVYVEMPGVAGTSWTLQYAVVRAPGADGVPVDALVNPPYPLEKHAPEFPAEVANQYQGRLMVVQGMIDREGKVQQLKLMQSPHPALAQALMSALQKCTFTPAQAAGMPVSIKFLLGVPVPSVALEITR